jgi:hypothetical protein
MELDRKIQASSIPRGNLSCPSQSYRHGKTEVQIRGSAYASVAPARMAVTQRITTVGTSFLE